MYSAETMEDENVENITIAKESITRRIKDKEVYKRSFEAMTNIIYKPKSIKGKRKCISRCLCASSTLSDGQEYMKKTRLMAAKKQGLSKETEVTALCDSAVNC